MSTFLWSASLSAEVSPARPLPIISTSQRNIFSIFHELIKREGVNQHIYSMF